MFSKFTRFLLSIEIEKENPDESVFVQITLKNHFLCISDISHIMYLVL
jgi:hypothetical protein